MKSNLQIHKYEDGSFSAQGGLFPFLITGDTTDDDVIVDRITEAVGMTLGYILVSHGAKGLIKYVEECVAREVRELLEKPEDLG